MKPIVDKALVLAEEEIIHLRHTVAELDKRLIEAHKLNADLIGGNEMGYEKDKGKAELAALRPILRASWAKRRWWHPMDLAHFVVDVAVESCRHAPYLVGHVIVWEHLAMLLFFVSWLLTR